MSGLKPIFQKFAAPILALGLLIASGVGAQPLENPGPPPAVTLAEDVKPVGERRTFEAPSANPLPSATVASVESGTEVKPDLKIVINIPSRTLWLVEVSDLHDGTNGGKTSEKIIKYYPVGLGTARFPTPTGKFKVIRMVKNPGWENPYKAVGAQRVRPGSANPLGTRWIGFHRTSQGEYGMHGTNQPASVGKFSSHGCVRMKVADAEDLFGKVDMGTPVEVIYDLALIRPADNNINLVTFADYYRKGLPKTAAIIEKIKDRFPEAVVDPAKVEQAIKTPVGKPIAVGVVKATS